NLDAIGPTRVGMHGIWLDRYGTSAPPPGVHAIRTLAELPALLGELTGGLTPAGFAAAHHG
ncbi:MAG TPA: hypothetical protein VF482_02105, partial [Trebonia sp.]